MCVYFFFNTSREIRPNLSYYSQSLKKDSQCYLGLFENLYHLNENNVY